MILAKQRNCFTKEYAIGNLHEATQLLTMFYEKKDGATDHLQLCLNITLFNLKFPFIRETYEDILLVESFLR